MYKYMHINAFASKFRVFMVLFFGKTETRFFFEIHQENEIHSISEMKKTKSTNNSNSDSDNSSSGERNIGFLL